MTEHTAPIPLPKAGEESIRRYFMRLSYCGAAFHGWQIQPNGVSVQSTVEQALTTVLRTPTPIVGAGRTDAGVNASMMVAHFDTYEPIADKVRMVKALNSLVGRDIAIADITEVHVNAHARFDATSRTYHYFAHIGKNPFLDRLSWEAPSHIDFEAMNRAARHLLDVDDFTSFAKLHSDARTNICKVTDAGWHRVIACDDTRWYFRITADRFLRNMVRAIVGTLVDVGRGKLTEDGFTQIIAQRNRCAAGTSMPPHPLYLHEVTYDYYPYRNRQIEL